MKKLIFSLMCTIFVIYSSGAQTLRMVMGSGAGKNFTLGQTFVGYSSGIPNKLWQGFWVPRNIATSINEETTVYPNISKLFPNPATSFINVESGEQIQSVQFYSVNGEILYENNNSQISLDNLVPNLYIVKITHTSGIVNFHKLVITR